MWLVSYLKLISSDATMPTYIPLAISIAEKAMHEFCKQWFSGLQPCLSLETAADGQIRVCSRVIAGDVATPPPRDAHHDAEQAQKRRRSPSYQRRLQQRAAAQKAAAAAKLADKAVVQVVSAEVHARPPSPQPFPIPEDELCPDKDYVLPTHDTQPCPSPQDHLADSIPQLDGGHGDAIDHVQHEDPEDWINPDPVTGMWMCRCCEYAHNFPTEDDLKLHHDTLMFEYDDCNICYPWHVWS